MAQWFVERAHELGIGVPMVAVHNATPTEADGLAPMVARQLRLHSIGEVVRTELQALGAEAPWEWELLERLVDPTQDDPRAPELQAALRSLFARMGAERPVVWWLDDAQWGRASILLGQRLTMLWENREALGHYQLARDLAGDDRWARGMVPAEGP